MPCGKRDLKGKKKFSRLADAQRYFWRLEAKGKKPSWYAEKHKYVIGYW